MRILTLEIIILAALGFTPPAEGQIKPIPIKGPIRHVQYGEGGSAKSAPKVIYANTVTSSYFVGAAAGYEVIDWGTIVSAADHDTVTDLAFGYGSLAPTVSGRLRVYDGYTGHCSVTGDVLLDMSLTGLPGGINLGGWGSAWIVDIDLQATGSCFQLHEGPFGCSWEFTDSVSGPLMAGWGTGQEDLVDVIAPGVGGSCNSWFGASPWTGFHLEISGHDGNDTFSGGCGGGLALGISGPTCTGSTVSIGVSGASVGEWWAVAIGTSIGTGIGGTLGGCPIDVVPVVPIRVMGQFPSQPMTFPATVSFASGLAVGLQVITKNPTSGAFDSSNTEIINVP